MISKSRENFYIVILTKTHVVIFRPIIYYQGNNTTPYFLRGKRDYSHKEVLEILVLDLKSNRVCSEVPQNVQENASFVIDTSKLLRRQDFTSDGNGGFRNNGHSGKIFKVENNKIISEKPLARLTKERANLETDEFLVKAVYWPHTKHYDFKRRCYEVSSHRGENVMVMVQYGFEGDSHNVSPSKKIKTSASTRHKIRQQAASSKTPSAIFDDLFIEAGGMNYKSPSDLPRSINQIKYERSKIRKESKVDEFSTLLNLSKDGKNGVTNLQWTPSPRFAVLDEEVVQEIVENCTSPTDFGPFMMDTTFNVGQFYVTTTCYTNLKLIDSRTGKHPSLPGPALFHQHQDTGQFRYFAQSLQEMNPDISNIRVIGSDRFNGFSTGFGAVCPIATVIVCKKHAEDDVDRKLTSLGITGSSRDEFMADIFGRERTKEVGLIDSKSPEDLDTKLFALEKVWNEREMECRSTSNPEFLDYFKSYVMKDMKEKMILPVRRNAGLGNEFFYDNATESINHRYKAHIRSSKAEVNIQGHRDLGCSLAEASKVYFGMLQETRRNVHRAIIGMGPYRLSPEYSHLFVAPTKWSELTPSQKLRCLRKLDKKVSIEWLDNSGTANTSTRENDEISTDEESSLSSADDCVITFCTAKPDTPCGLTTHSSINLSPVEIKKEVISSDEDSDVLCNFSKTGLPEMLAGSWHNAQKILSSGGIGPAPGNKNARVVTSLTGNGYHKVTLSKNQPTNCDCEKFKEKRMCAHTIATAFKEGTLDRYIMNYSVDLTNLVKPSKNAGKKQVKRSENESGSNNNATYLDTMNALKQAH